MNRERKQVILVVLDGWGYREEKEHNAIAEANTPYFDYLWQNYSHGLLDASGTAVGLPEGQSGGSEIGHLAIGAGKPIKTDLIRINEAISNNTFSNNVALLELFNHVKKYDSFLHVAGLIGPGGIHAHSDHLFAAIKAAKEAGLSKVIVHVFTDGRDTPPQDSAKYLEQLEELLLKLGAGFISTVSGRYFAMDRDNNWDRFAKAEKAIFHGEASQKLAEKPSQTLKRLYTEGKNDEHLEPIVFLDEGGKHYPIADNDGVLLINFRADRARMFSQKILEKQKTSNLFYVTMTEYDKTFGCPVAFPPETIETTLAKEISNASMTQFHIAETEKYAHATYFLNGGQENPHQGEARLMIESRKDIKTPDQAPKLRAEEITNAVLEELPNFDFIFINYANLDLVGHSAKKNALVEAIEEVDRQLEKLVNIAAQNGSVIFITADHGNAEENIDKDGNPHTAHTNNPVPAILVSDQNYSIESKGALTDIAPTILELFSLPIPSSMTGQSLLKK